MWKKIKRILQKEGGKCIIMEEGEPVYIVSRLDDNEEISESKPQETEKVNQNIAEWQNKETEDQNEILPEEELSGDSGEKENKENNQEVKIEDLPF